MAIDLTFEQIVRDHQAMVFRTLARLTGRCDTLEDLAQDVFLRLYRALPNFRGEALVSTYLYRIAVNVARDEWARRRHDRRHVSLSEEDQDWEETLEHPGRNAAELMEEEEFADLVHHQLACLSHVERSILVLYHQEQRTYQQIATILALPIGTVRTHLHRGRNKMRQGLMQGAGVKR